MNKGKQEWDKHVTPKLGTFDAMQRVLDWGHELPIKNLEDMHNSWVGYLWKYYPDRPHPYHLKGKEI